MDFTLEEVEAMSVNEARDTYPGLEDLTYDGGDNYQNSVNGDGGAAGDVNGHGHDDDVSDDNLDYISEGGGTADSNEDDITINGVADFLHVDMKNISVDDAGRFDFTDLEVAYLFYCWYARINGFSVRKSHVVRSKKGEILQQTFVCSREGYREDRGLTLQTRKREPRHETRCGCEAKMRVHIDIHSMRWYVTVFSFNHNHELLEDKFCALLPAHRKISPADIIQIENFGKGGIRPSHMYSAFASVAGGYDKIGFVKKDIYNQVGKQRRQHSSDASGALKFLRGLSDKDPLMFVRYIVDDNGRLEHLFWCDGESRMNFEVFGDVLAFDATYRKNKYLCPLVVFSGVNHHNQTVVFATALVSDETEETYVWLLEQFLHAMKGKAPISVITDGDLAMKNAINRVFPYAHHRLCAWHLLRNAISNVGNSDVMPYLKRCMLGDYDVGEFEKIWAEMVGKYGLEENNWITELYERRKMWCTAHIRGNFFAGIRTTSRCEALHSHIKQFIHSRINLSDFVQQFQRCLSYFRFREVEADFQSNYGDAVLQTNLHYLERSASRHFTKEIMQLFRPVLKKASLIRVNECQEMSTFFIYVVSKYRGRGSMWQVSYCPSLVEFRCSCLRLESIGLPCDHIIAVLVYLDFVELPKSLVLNRWTKSAKESIRGTFTNGSLYWDSNLIARYATLVFMSREVSELAYRDVDDYNTYLDLLTGELGRLRLKYSSASVVENAEMQTQTMDDNVQDPPCVRTKGCGTSTNTTSGRSRRTQTCRTCGRGGHNRRSCPVGRQREQVARSLTVEDDDVDDHDNDFFNQLNEEPDAFIGSTSGAVHFG